MNQYLTNAWHVLRSFHSFLALVFGAAAVARKKWQQQRRQQRAAMWPSADAVIQSVPIRPQQGYWVEAEYRFFAHQEYHYGKYRRHFFRKASAEQFASAIAGRHVQVRYHEEDPEISVLLDRDLEMTAIGPSY